MLGRFETEGPSKKAAKAAAACQVLDQVFGVKASEFNPDTVMKSPAERKPPVQLLYELCQIQVFSSCHNIFLPIIRT